MLYIRRAFLASSLSPSAVHEPDTSTDSSNSYNEKKQRLYVFLSIFLPISLCFPFVLGFCLLLDGFGTITLFWCGKNEDLTPI